MKLNIDEGSGWWPLFQNKERLSISSKNDICKWKPFRILTQIIKTNHPPNALFPSVSLLFAKEEITNPSTVCRNNCSTRETRCHPGNQLLWFSWVHQFLLASACTMCSTQHKWSPHLSDGYLESCQPQTDRQELKLAPICTKNPSQQSQNAISYSQLQTPWINSFYLSHDPAAAAATTQACFASFLHFVAPTLAGCPQHIVHMVMLLSGSYSAPSVTWDFC